MFPVMGTVASIVVATGVRDVLGADAVESALDAAQRQLEGADHRFSHYTRESEISVWLGGGSVSPEALADFDYVIRECGRLRDESGGVFTMRDPRTGGVDTAGFVKGYAIRRAAEVLRSLGVHDFMLCVGGDTYCSGHADADRPWRVGVVDPMRSKAVAAIVELTDLAIATSGTAERGDHIWNGRGPARSDLASFTVVGPDIAEADAFATIGFAMGESGVAWVAAHEGYRSLAIRPDGSAIGDAALVSVA